MHGCVRSAWFLWNLSAWRSGQSCSSQVRNYKWKCDFVGLYWFHFNWLIRDYWKWLNKVISTCRNNGWIKCSCVNCNHCLHGCLFQMILELSGSLPQVVLDLAAEAHAQISTETAGSCYSTCRRYFNEDGLSSRESTSLWYRCPTILTTIVPEHPPMFAHSPIHCTVGWIYSSLGAVVVTRSFLLSHCLVVHEKPHGD